METADLRGVMSPSTQVRLAELNRQEGKRFIKGPIQLPWIAKAAALSSGKAVLAASLALCYAKGLERSATFRIAARYYEPFGIKRKALNLALDRMEEAGLVRLERLPGRAATVTILEVDIRGQYK